MKATDELSAYMNATRKCRLAAAKAMTVETETLAYERKQRAEPAPSGHTEPTEDARAK